MVGSVASASSFSSHRSNTNAARPALRAGGDSSKDSVEQPPTLLTGIFGVLFTLSKEKNDFSWKIAAIKMILDWIQLFTIIINPYQGWDFVEGGAYWIVDWINITPLVDPWSYTLFLVLLYLMVAALLVALLLCIWVAWSFKNKTFAHIWPIVVVKFFVGVFFQVFDVASLNLFQIAMSCQVWGPYTAAQQFHLQAFPSVDCRTTSQLIHIFVSAITLLVFVALVTMVNIAELELNPLSTRPFSAAHSGVEIQSFLIKFLMTVVSAFIGWQIFASFILMFLVIYLFWLHIRWMPFTHEIMNHVRIGMYLSIVWASITYVALSIQPTSKITITMVMWAGLGPCMVLGFGFSWLRLNLFAQYVLRRFRACQPGTPSLDIFEFEDPRDVEIVMRCCRKWVKRGVVDPEAMRVAGRVVEAGLQQFPAHPFMIITYSNYLIEVQGSVQSGYSQVHVAKKSNPSLMVKFAIFSREQMHTQQMATASSGQSGVDLISYVEFQRHQRRVIQAHKEALITIRLFWQLLLSSRISFTVLSRALNRIEASVVLAEKMYKVVLDQYPSAARILSLYAKFLEDVKNDPYHAAQYYVEVEKLEGNSEDDQFGEGLEDGADEGNSLLKTVGKSNGVVVINSLGIIQMVNKTLAVQHGYEKASDLKGKSVNTVIPPPFAQHHDAYIREYIRTGKDHVLNVVREWISLHKERYVVPVRIALTRISGTGEDSVFMGILEFLKVKHNEAKIWTLPSGTIISMDLQFSDWFGFRPEDLMGTNVSGLALKSDVFSNFLESEALKKAFQERVVSLSERKVQVDNTRNRVVKLRHKFCDPLECTITMSMGGGDKVKLCIFTFRFVKKPTQMMVVDARGQCVYVTGSLADLIGYKPQEMRNLTLAELIPQPYAQLHQKTYLHDTEKEPPPWSCRTGTPVMLVTGRGKSRTPVKLKITSSNLSGEMLHVVLVDVLDNDMLLDSRRLRMFVDRGTGIVTWVAPSPANLFSFDPQLILGRPLSMCVDELRKASEEGNLPAVVESLANRSMEAPGDSYRVFVAPPLDPEDIQKLGNLAEKVLAHVTRQAVMTVGNPASRNEEAATLVDQIMARKAVMEIDVTTGATRIAPPSGTFGDDEPHLNLESCTSVHSMGEVQSVPRESSVSFENRSPKAIQKKESGLGNKPEATRGGLFSMMSVKNTRAREAAANSLSEEGPRALQSTVSRKSPDERSQLLPTTASRKSPTENTPFLEMNSSTLKSLDEQREFVSMTSMMSPKAGNKANLSLTSPKSPMGQVGLPSLNKFQELECQSVNTAAISEPLGSELPDASSVRRRAYRALQPGVEFEVCLWRMDMLKAVLEVDKDGVITKYDPSLTFQPGLMFGVTNEALVGRPMKNLLSWTGTLAGLLHKEGGVRGALKGTESSARVAGTIHYLTARYADGGHMKLAVQAVGQEGGRKGMSLLLHVSDPGGGAPEGSLQTMVSGRRASITLLSENPPGPHGRRFSVADRRGSRSSQLSIGESAGGKPHRVSVSMAEGGSLTMFKSPQQAAQVSRLGSPTSQEHSNGSAKAITSIRLKTRQSSSTLQVSSKDPCDEEGDEFLGSQTTPPPGAGPVVPVPRRANFKVENDDDLIELDRQDSGVMKGKDAEGTMPGSPSETRRKAPTDRIKEWILDAEITPPTGRPARPSSPEAHDEGEEEEEEEEEENNQKLGLPPPIEPIASLKRDQSDGSIDYAASEMSSGDDMARNSQINFKRAKRYKKLVRMFSDPATTKWLRRLSVHSIMVVVILLLTHVVIFAILITYINNQMAVVQAVHDSADALEFVEQMGTVARILQMCEASATGVYFVYTAKPVAGLMGGTYSQLLSIHHSLYLQAQTDPTMLKLWNDKVWLEEKIYAVQPTTKITYENVSLWDMGNNFLDNLIDVVSYYTVYGSNMSSQPSWNYLLNNGPFTLHSAYETVLNQLILNGVDSANVVDYLNLAVIPLEVGLLCTLLSAYLWWLLLKVSQQRFNLYSVFLAIPLGLTRSLASKSIALNSDSEDDSDSAEDRGEGARAPANSAPTNFAANKMMLNEKINSKSNKGGNNGNNGWLNSMVTQAVGLVTMQPQQFSTKRTLVYKTYENLWFMAPFLLWGLVLAVIYAICFFYTSGMGKKLGPFMSSALCQAYIVRMAFASQEYALSSSLAYRLQTRTWVNESLNYIQGTYSLLLYGTLPPPSVGYEWTDLQYEALDLATAYDTMFGYGCTRTGIPCVPAASPYYAVSRLGLDAVMRRTFYEAVNLLQFPIASVVPTNPAFQYILNVALIDAEDGLSTLRQIQTDEALSNYTLALDLQIVAFVASWFIMIFFLVCLLRPFVQRNRKESMRIAELLSQLPNDVDVEKLVATVLRPPAGSAKEKKRAAAQEAAKSKAASDPDGGTTTSALSKSNLASRLLGAKEGMGSMTKRKIVPVAD